MLSQTALHTHAWRATQGDVKVTESLNARRGPRCVNSSTRRGSLLAPACVPLMTWLGTHRTRITSRCSYLKENSKNEKKDEKSPKKGSKKRKAAKNTKNDKPKAKKPKMQEWDSKNADENAEYEVERILEVHHKKNGKREFLIHWKGWSNRYDSWEPENNLNCPELINKFMSKVSAARSVDSRNLRVNPESTQRFTLQDPSSGRRLSKRRGQRQR
ncbi:Chromobox protein homolog 5 [Eumeta japonica]|uniref:Chromobox protein homolog 5 n=1 Tax=Eumeta variegata TaxID=151549 RepID=A0A4C1U0J0_EUMVA|nr:Chromobox protein homolog 5 [Eumeta japonica]